MRSMTVFLTLLLYLITPFAHAQSNDSTRQWLAATTPFTLSKLHSNISPADGLPGAVIAAKTRYQPNYYYHWVRDAGLTIDAMIDMYSHSATAQQKEMIAKNIFEYLGFSSKIQHTQTMTGLGEPKFNVDGTAFNDLWGRPQNDSPALRAISLIHWANVLIKEGKINIVRERMYTADMPADSPIKMDLEYISQHWKDPTYDLWEEVKATHFYTLMVERRALLEGASLAHKLGDQGAADWYYQQGKAIEKVLLQFWNPKQNLIMASFNWVLR
jgi:glucoamylase